MNLAGITSSGQLEDLIWDIQEPKAHWVQNSSTAECSEVTDSGAAGERADTTVYRLFCKKINK